jgi:hypothetical protein
MADDPRVRWQLATPFGIQVNKEKNMWHSGHVNDVIPLTDVDSLLVATETGGIWLVDKDNGALALSTDWDVPDVKCMAMGPDGTRQVFAGCTIAYDSTDKRSYRAESGSAPVIMETDASALAPLLAWSPISAPLPKTAGRITRIVVIPRIRRMVVSCARVRDGDTGGVFWATIPVTRFAPGDPPRPPFVWRQARIGGGGPGAFGFWDIAVAATRDNASRDNLEDRSTITLVAGGFRQGGIYVGQWNRDDDLVFQRAAVQAKDGSDATALQFDNCGTIAVSSCELHPTRLYASCADPGGRFNAVLRSKDGGRNWTFCGSTLRAGGGQLGSVFGGQGKDWNNCISAHPKNPSIAAIGWDTGAYLTFDAGETWKLLPGGDHLHADYHILRFSIEAPESIGFLFAGSDGGVAKVDLDNLDEQSGPAARSDFNRNLPTLQCYSLLYRQFTGTVDIQPELSGVVMAGLQDNGNVTCRFRPTPTPWQHVDRGDGGLNTAVRGGYLHNFLDSETIATAPLSDDVQVKVVPMTVPPPAAPQGLKSFVGEAVMEPRHVNAAGQLLVGVAAANGSSTVFGLYANDRTVPPYEWQQIGVLPAGQTVAGVGSVTGDQVFVGTGQGKVFVIDTNAGSVVEQPVKLPKPSPGSQMAGGTILRIVALDASSIFAVLLIATEKRADGTVPFGGPAVQNYILRLDNGTWSPTPATGLPNELLYGFVAVVAPNSEIPRGLLAATDDAVYISRDDSQTWQRASSGLPRRPHCSDLRFAIVRVGGPNLVLGTFGRSMWVASLD